MKISASLKTRHTISISLGLSALCSRRLPQYLYFPGAPSWIAYVRLGSTWLEKHHHQGCEISAHDQDTLPQHVGAELVYLSLSGISYWLPHRRGELTQDCWCIRLLLQHATVEARGKNICSTLWLQHFGYRSDQTRPKAQTTSLIAVTSAGEAVERSQPQ
jgi:hypothetical protein